MEMKFLFLGHFTEVEAGKGEVGLGISGRGWCRRWGITNGGCIDQLNRNITVLKNL